LASAAHTYELHGLVVESPIPLDGQRVDRPPDYRVVEGESHHSSGPPPGRLLAEYRLGELNSWAAEDADDPARRTLRYGGICDVVVDRRERAITVHPRPGAERELLSILLCSSVLAHVLAMQGQPCLHASAIETGGEALAIVGSGGGGKSTLASILCAAGARLVSDDALRVGFADERAECFLGTGVLRLRPSAAELVARFDGIEQHLSVDERICIAPPRPRTLAVPLRAILLPRPSHEARELDTRSLGPREALLELVRFPRLISWLGGQPVRDHFVAAARLAKTVPVFGGSVPWGPPFAEDLAAELLDAVGMSSPLAATGRGGSRASSRRPAPKSN
jgi:hypothetical protein